jgi:plastocyanin
VTFKFTKPGVYVYYCQEHATYDPKTHRVMARKETDQYPIAMEGLIVVRGPGFVGAPTASVTIPGDSYVPYVTVVRAGGTVTWTNKDSERHMVAGAPGDGAAFELNVFPGKSQSKTFATPGILFYYCDLHATYNPKLGLAAAKKDADIFPASQQGYVIVL